MRKASINLLKCATDSIQLPFQTPPYFHFVKFPSMKESWDFIMHKIKEKIFFCSSLDVVMVYAWKERQKFEFLMKIILWDIEKVKTEMIKPQTTTKDVPTSWISLLFFCCTFSFCVNDKTFFFSLFLIVLFRSCLFLFRRWQSLKFFHLEFLTQFNFFCLSFYGFFRKSSTLNSLHKKLTL